MKKLAASLLIFSVLSCVYYSDYTVAEERLYSFEEVSGSTAIYDKTGKLVKNTPYIWVEYAGNGIIFADNSTRLRGMLDMDLNVVIEPEYAFIEYNSNNDTYMGIKQDSTGHETGIDFYDGSFNKVPQPQDIRDIGGTEYYYLTVINESNSDEKSLYICDSEGNKLIEQAFDSIEGEGGSIIVREREQFKEGVYDSDLNIKIPVEYDSVTYDNSRFYCTKYATNEKGETIADTVCFYTDFSPAPNVDKVYGTEYFTIKGDDGLYYICDEEGNVLKEQGYCFVDGTENGLKVRTSDKYPRLYGFLDNDLNEVLEEKYYRIGSKPGHKTVGYIDDKIEIYDRNFNLIETEDSDLVFVTPIEGMEGRYVYNEFPDNDELVSRSLYVIDDEGNKLAGGYVSIDTKAGPGNTLIVKGLMGTSDVTSGVLNQDLKLITGMDFGNVYVREENDVIYIERIWDDNIYYYDLLGNRYDAKAEAIANGGNINEISDWAVNDVERGKEVGIVPESLQSAYRMKITRKEFCQLAISTYISKEGYEVDLNEESPFNDIDDPYVTAAYNLNIVAGTGQGRFSPDNNITRQEAAVMLNNLAKLLNVKQSENVNAFVDESYFAQWAKEAIYSVAGMKSGDTYVMAGTGEGKFSPWMNYTREQAIVTMVRLYDCDESEEIQSSEKLTLTTVPVEDDDVIYNIYRLVNEKGDIVAEYPYIVDTGCGVYIYKVHSDENDYTYNMGLLDSYGNVIINAEYEDINVKPYNDTITFKKGDVFDIYDCKGNLKKSVTYDVSAVNGEIPYVVSEIYGSNVVVRRWADRFGMYGINSDHDYYIYRLFSGTKTADDYFSIRSFADGKFIANDVSDNMACVLDADGELLVKTEYGSIYDLDEGLYCGRKEFDSYQACYVRGYMEPTGEKDCLTLFDENLNVIEDHIDDVGIEVDSENKCAYVTRLGEEIVVKY